MSWRLAAYRSVRPVLFTADPEAIHRVTLAALDLAGRTAAGRALCRLASGLDEATASHATIDVLGLRFRNRVGIGAGFDKDGVAVRGWAALGLGFAEVGTVTPQPQAGNPRPRLFRLPEDQALINRMGFNNSGADALAARIARVRGDLPAGFVVGVNIGRNAATPDDHALADYVAAARSTAPVADYLAVNVSSPNTPGLRDLQEPARLTALLDVLAAVEPRRPLLVKLAPDLDPPSLESLLAALDGSPAGGVILSNTTTARGGLRSSRAREAGGASGPLLRDRLLAAVERARRAVPRLAIIGSGGIASGIDARAAIDAGADLVQLWTGLVYAGPGLIGETVRRTA